MSKLRTIPGIGAKTAARLVEYFGSEEAALEAIEELDLFSLSSSGLGMRPALNVVLAFFSKKLGVSPDDVLRTQDARSLYAEALHLFKSRVVNPLARHRIDLLYPLPMSRIDVISERLELSRQYVQVVSSLTESDLSAVDESLRSLRPTPRVARIRAHRTIIVESEEDYDRLTEMGIEKFCRIEKLEDDESLRQYLKSEEHIILILKRSVYDLDLDTEFVEVIHEVPPPIRLVPELVTQLFTQNLETLRGLEALAKLLDRFPGVPAIERVRSRLSLDALRPILEVFDELSNPSSRKGRNVARLENSLAKIEDVLRETEISVNSSVEKYLSTYEAKVSGEKIAELLREATADRVSSARLMRVIPTEVLERIRSTVHRADHSIREALVLEEEEIEWLEGIFPDSVALPIEMSGKVADGLRMNISRKLIWLRFKVLSDIACRLEESVAVFRDALSAAFELDALLAIGKVGSSRGFTIPRTSGAQPGIWFSEATNTRLLATQSSTPIQMVTYGIGSGSEREGRSGERIVLLTGANSGGKTMLLSTIAQVAMLAQAGLPVPAAEAKVSPVDQIFYFSRPAGMKDAGGFESALTALVDVASTSPSKLVLVDEFEAATEPGAAAKVLAAVLEMLARQENSLVVVVTHLAQQLLSNISVPLRVDGIEAKGLDSSYNLIVDRSPKINYLARSTPELIVERLVHKSDGSVKEIYGRILEKIRTAQ